MIQMMRPELTELQRVKMENYALRYNLLQQQTQQVINERASFISQLEEAYPGYEWREGFGLAEKDDDMEREEVRAGGSGL
jgi:hypothetical protein